MARVQRSPRRIGFGQIELIDALGRSVPIVSEFITYLSARGCSPNTRRAYSYDLGHLWCFLEQAKFAWDRLTTERAADFLIYLRREGSQRRGQPRAPVLMIGGHRRPMRPRLSSASVNRALAAVSSFYDWAALSGHFVGANPIAKTTERANLRVTGRHRPFLHGIARKRPLVRALSVKTVRRLPRPMSAEHIDRLFSVLRCARDIALMRLMLDGGLRPGEALGLHLTDIAFGRRRVVIRWRDDHPRGVRSKSRTERMVDLHEDATLSAMNTYIMTERPRDTDSPYVFLVGGKGRNRFEALSYAALARLFARATERAGIRAPWITPHALRHTHATRMWEAGMRELTLQRRLGHASPESTRLYTRVSNAIVVAEYRRAVGLDPPAIPEESSTTGERTT
jgi:integrase/recombinase XerD